MSEQLSCHSSARCESNHLVKRIDGSQERMDVHNIHVMQSDGHLEGFTKDKRGIRHGVVKLLASDVWIEEY